MGNYPDATAVFDVYAIGLVNIVHNLNRGLDIGGNPIGAGTDFVIGVGANPGVPISMRKSGVSNTKSKPAVSTRLPNLSLIFRCWKIFFAGSSIAGFP